MIRASVDFETRSDVDLRKHGAARYFASPHWRALICCYSIDGGEVQTWTAGPCPVDLRAAIEAGALIRAHNAAFERLCFDTLHAREGWPRPALDRYRCTAAEAAAMALPRKLEGVAEALATPVQKDKRGAALIRKFSMPRRARKGDIGEGPFWNEPVEHPDDFAAFCAYCADDVRTEAAVAARLVPLSDDEQAVYALDQVINDRGVRLDVVSIRAALEIAEKSKALLDLEIETITGGVVRKLSEAAKLVSWVKSRGVPMETAQKAEISALLEFEDLPDDVRRALELRQDAKTSVSKLQAMLDRASADDRARGTIVYHAASTGRFQSRGINLNNLPRPRREFDEARLDRGALFAAIRRGDPQLLRFLYGDELGRPMHLLSDAIRGFLWSAPGYDLLQADYSGIEGAVIAWSSGEAWKLAEMHAILADPKRPDLYRQTAAAIMNTTTDVITKKHPLRQSVGKVSELALGFGGGVKAFHSMSLNYGVKLAPLFDPVWATADEERRVKAAKRYAGCLRRGKDKTDVLSREAWIAAELIKVGWRASNPAIAAGWRAREDAIRAAVREPGTQTTALCMSYLVAHGFLIAKLPSGRCLFYGAPRLKDQVWAKLRLEDGSYADAEVMGRAEAEMLERKGEALIQGATSPAVTALGTDKSGNKLERFALYGGLAAENDTQAIARDLLVNGMRKAEAAGYPIIGHVYDEIICEVPRGIGDLAAFEKLICELPPWAAGLPLTAGGWRGKRYRKD